jgi:hypothetical protein
VFGDLDILSFVKISRLKWIGRVNRMESKRTVSQVFNNNPQGSGPRGRPRNRWWNCVQTDIKKCKINNWKEGEKTELTGKGPLRRRRSALDCSATEEEEEDNDYAIPAPLTQFIQKLSNLNANIE